MDEGEQGTPPTDGQRRSHSRVEINAEAMVRRDGSNNYRVRILDISESGCKIEIVERPSVGEGIWVRFDGLQALHATVTWIAPPVAGIEFDHPIHPAVFDGLIRKFANKQS